MIMHDELDDLLTPHDSIEQASSSALPATLPVLRRRRIVRQSMHLIAALACFALGMWTMDRMRGGAAPEIRYVRVPVPTETKPREEPLSPSELELRAAESEGPRPDLFREAGDRYWAEERDAEAALRCYRRALEENPDEVMTISSKDSWLMIALKDARREEMNEP